MARSRHPIPTRKIKGASHLGSRKLPQRNGSQDFDSLIGDWKAYVRHLPDRLNNSNVWVEYDGISSHDKILDSNSNFEEFEVTSIDKKLDINGRTLRLYNRQPTR